MNFIKLFPITLFSMITAVSFLSLPALSYEKYTDINSLDEINDRTFSGINVRGDSVNAARIAAFSQEKDLISLQPVVDFFPEDLTIDLTLRDVDVASILRIIAEEGGKNIVIDNSVIGYVSAELKDISLNEAMQIILTSQELEARLSKGTIFVASRPVMAKKGLNRRFIKTFKLNNSNPVHVAQLLEVSIFNKGYQVDEMAAGAAMQAVPAPAGMGEAAVQSEPVGSTVGQTSLVNSKMIKGKVEELVSGENFGDANKLASTIKIQEVKSSTRDIHINNNDGGAIVIPDTRTNSILVAGLREDILMAEEIIKELDKPLRQVSIEVSLIELKKQDDSDLGVLLNTQRGGLSGGFNTVNGLTGYDFSSAANQTGITLNTLNNLSENAFAVELKALIKNKKAKLLANPRILALDDSESLIKITDQVISKIQTTITQTSITYNTEVADVGIVLNILPKIGDDDYITMRIRPSITDPLPEITVGDISEGEAAVRVTPISTREVILQNVRVRSGETLAIAGLKKENSVEEVGKIPVLGQLPVVGKLFQNKDFVKYKTELLILITPKIVQEENNTI